MAFECDRARQLLFRAESTVPPEDRMVLFGAEILTRIYTRILARIEARRFDVLGDRVDLADARKSMIALNVWFKYKLLGP